MALEICISALYGPWLSLSIRRPLQARLSTTSLRPRRGAKALKPSVKVLCRPSLILQQRALQKVPVEFKNTWRRLAPAEHRRPSSTRDPGPRPRTTRCAPPWRVTVWRSRRPRTSPRPSVARGSGMSGRRTRTAAAVRAWRPERHRDRMRQGRAQQAAVRRAEEGVSQEPQSLAAEIDAVRH